MSNEIEKVDFFGTEYDINGSRLAQKANIDGAYESMTVGNAEQLISSVTVNDKVPYNFRTSGGSIDIGNREVDKLVGGTVAWNQLVPFQSSSRSFTQNNVTLTDNRDGSFTVQTTSEGASEETSLTLTSAASSRGNHVGLIVGCPAGGWSNAYKYRLFEAWGLGQDYGNGKVGRFVASGNYDIRIAINSGTVITTPIKFVPQFFDLTQMFGTTIADYIYSLETATAGAGVAFFKKLFPKDYYPYNAGQLMSVKTSAHQMVGFNAWDEEWEVGGISNSTGENTVADSYFRSKNYIPIISGQSYYLKCGLGDTFGMRFYDANKHYFDYGAINSNQVITPFIPSGTAYIRFVDVSRNSYNPSTNPICINLHWDGERDGDYEAYKKWTYPLDSDLELRGIPKLDSANNLYYDGDTYEDDGTVNRRFGIVDLGTLTYNLNSGGTGHQFYGTLPSRAPNVNVNNAICSAYVWGNAYNNNVDKCIQPRGAYVWIQDSAYSDIALLKASLSGVYLVYELETPTTEEADPYQNPQIVDDFGTEEYIDERTVAIPVGHDTEYMNNLKAKLEMAPDSPDGDGDYVVRQTNGENSYVPLMKELPNAPSEDGTYILKCTVASGTATLGWEREE